MIFSIIVPTYNPKKYLPGLLESISRNDCINDVEIIISDDCSSENFDNVIKQFDSLHIRKAVNDKHYGFPKNGRQNGAKIACGEWICFADQDDVYVDNAFDKVREFIELTRATNYIISNFIIRNCETNVCELVDGRKGWTHGKFYQKSFWDKYHIEYDDLEYCEDINLSTKINCIMVAENLQKFLMQEPVYIWNRRTDSLSNGQYFMESMSDYVNATLGVIVRNIENLKSNSSATEQLTILFICTLYHIYAYYQSDMLNDKRTMLKTMLIILDLFDRFTKVTKVTASDIIRRTDTDLRDTFNVLMDSDKHYVPHEDKMTFTEWMRAYIM